MGCDHDFGNPQHTFVMVTKRPVEASRRLRYLCSHRPLKNAWLLASASKQLEVEAAIPFLIEASPVVRFVGLHLEPLVGEVDLTVPRIHISGRKNLLMPEIRKSIDWLVVGGENGPGARPMDPAWAIQLWDQAKDAGLPIWIKGWGSSKVYPFPGAPLIQELPEELL